LCGDWFESHCVASQAVRRVEIYPRQSKKCPPMAGFYELVGGFRAPVLASSGPEQPIVSGQYLKYSRFQETSAGDRVRSTSRGRRGSRVSLAGSFENRFHPSNRPPKSVASGAPERERLNTELRDALRRRYDRSRYWVRFCSRSSSSLCPMAFEAMFSISTVPAPSCLE
jgi:hypothetical protein